MNYCVELRRSNGSNYNDIVYLATDYRMVAGLLTDGKVKSSLLPTGNSSAIGGVKLSNNYNPASPGADVALDQAGAKALYQMIQNLESPLDYVTSVSVNWGAATLQSTINDYLNSQAGAITTVGPGTAVLINNAGDYSYDAGTYSINTTGYWLWVFNGTNWVPAIDYPEVPNADDTGASESAMVAGIMTKAMVWKLKNITAGATKVEDGASNGNIKINGTETVVYAHPTTEGNKHVPSGGLVNQMLKYTAAGTVGWTYLKSMVLEGYSKGANTGALNEADTLEIALSKLENKLATNASAISSNDSDITALQNEVSSNASSISTNASNISTNASNIATNASGVSANSSAITVLQTAVSDNEADITTLEGLVQALPLVLVGGAQPTDVTAGKLIMQEVAV